MRDDQVLPHLAALAILLNSHARGQATGDGAMQLATPDGTAGLIDQLRATGIILTYDPETRTIRTGDSHPVAVTAAGR